MAKKKVKNDEYDAEVNWEQTFLLTRYNLFFPGKKEFLQNSESSPLNK